MSLKQNLINLIKTHGRLTHREVVQYCLDNGYKPSNAERRMREVMREDVSILPERHSGTILAYTFSPTSDFKPPRRDFMPQDDIRHVSEEKPHSEPVNALKTKWQKSPEFFRPTDKCCPIAILCYEKSLPIQHSQRCHIEKQEK